MSDLVVKYHELEESQAALKKIMNEFNNATDRVNADSSIWSNGHVEDAMHSFATNWKDHRGKLLKKMDEAYKDSEKTIQTWEKADAQLAQSLDTHQTSGPGRRAN